MIIIHYEVYVQEPRGWMLHARYPRQEREGALGEAKELERLSLKTRVVRETYYTDTNKFDEADIYMTGKGLQEKAPPREERAPSRAGAPAARGSKRAAPRKAAGAAAKRRPARSTSGGAPASRVFGRLLAIIALALAVSILAVKVTPDIIMQLWAWGWHPDLAQQTYGQVLFGIFALTFLMVAVPLSVKFLPRQAEISIRSKASMREQAAANAAAIAAQRQRQLKASLNRLADQAMSQGYDEEPAPKPVEPQDLFEEDEDLPEIQERPEETLPEIRPDSQGELPPRLNAQEASPAVMAASGNAESQRASVMRFLGGAVNAVKSTGAALDNYNKFALHLYLAGSVDALCDTKGMGDNDRRQLTATALETLGTSPDLARRFHDKMGEYLMEPRYLQVVQAGRSAMEDFSDGRESVAHNALKGVIKDWNRPAEKKVSIVTVMFTDMVGSTDLTQARGDIAAQEVVRRHNTIVRSAVGQYGGKEIKHTGDGIMASFPSAGNAVEAAVNIQQQVAAHNQRLPDQGLHLRIGLNAGEPIQEEDDLFGTTVQMAARVCAATQPDQILCTSVVKDLAQGKGGSYVHAGSHSLKGFRDEVVLFEVRW